MAKAGRKSRRLTTRSKGNGLGGGKWRHNFEPKNAVARAQKKKTWGQKGGQKKTSSAKTGSRAKKR